MLAALTLPGLSPTQSRVYAYIVGRTEHAAPLPSASVGRIAGALNTSRKSVRGAIVALRKADLISVERCGDDPIAYVIPGAPAHERPRHAEAHGKAVAS